MATATEIATEAAAQLEAAKGVLPNEPINTNGTEKLINDLESLEQQSTETHEDLDTLHGNLQAIDKKLLLVKDADDDLKALDDLLGSVDSLLKLVQVVPSIKQQVQDLDAQVQALRKPVHNSRLEADEAEEKVKPWRDRLETVVQDVHTVETAVGNIESYTPMVKSAIQELKSCIDGLQDDNTKKADLQIRLAFASNNLDPAVVLLTEVLRQMDAPVKAANSTLDNAKELFDPITDLITELVHVTNMLNPLVGPLNKLAAALSHRIGIKKFSFTIAQILAGIKLPWPFGDLVDEFEAKAMTYLKPFLEALHLDIRLPQIPGLDALDKFANAFGKVMDSLEKEFADMQQPINSLVEATSDFFDSKQWVDIKCPPDPG